MLLKANKELQNRKRTEYRVHFLKFNCRILQRKRNVEMSCKKFDAVKYFFKFRICFQKQFGCPMIIVNVLHAF